MLNPNPKLISTQKFVNSNYAYNQEQFSVATSAASASEDDSSAYNLPTLFIEVAPLQEEQKPGSTKTVIFRNEEQLGTDQKNFTKQIKRKSLINSETTFVADSLNSDDDEHMISIDLQGLQENPLILREKFIKGDGNYKLAKEETDEDKFSAKLKQYDDWKRDQQLERSTSNGQAAFVERPYNEPASKGVDNFSVNHTRDQATTHVGIYEGESFKAQRNASSCIEKPPPNLGGRQKSINSTKVLVSSKWDDADKWLCYDNHVSPHHKVKNSPISGQKLHSNKVTLDRGNLSVSKSNTDCKDNHASPNRGNLNVNKASECKDNHGLKDDVACANHLTMQNTPSRGSQSIYAVSRGKHAFASQSSNSNGLLKSKMLEDDNLKRKWFGTNLGAPGKGDCDYMSSGEILNPHILSNKLAATSASDGEIHANIASNCQHYHASQTSISSGSTSGAESKKKDNFKTTFERWKKDNYDDSVVQHRIREFDYLSSGELLRQASNHQNLAAISTSDGEMYANYTSDQQCKSNASYTQRFKQHHILQKLRRKCSPSNGGRKGAVQHVREDGAQNLVGKNGNGRVVSVHAASRLSNISMQASPKKDQFCTQGEYTMTQSVGKLEKEEAEEASVCINVGMQREFEVQTPTHGRSASMKDACTEVSPSLSRRDMGTQMTPSESSPFTSKCTSPMYGTSPARHNTPTCTSPTLNPQMNNIDIARADEDGINSSARKISQYNNGNALELESCHWEKLELRDLPSGGQPTSEKNNDLGSVYNDWSPAICLEEEIVHDEGEHENDAVDEMHTGGIMKRLNLLDARAVAWEEAERAKFHAKYKREEARINAWENLQKAKAEAELKKLEVKLERLRSRATEKVLSKVAMAERRAAEMRVAAEAQQTDQMRKVREKACNLRKTALFPGSFAVCFARNYMP